MISTSTFQTSVLLPIVTVVALVASAYTVSAATGGEQKVGQCTYYYQKCVNDPTQTQETKQRCDWLWGVCVQRKCGESSLVGFSRQCPKDPDCETACTEAASSVKGLLSCCLGGPKHNNSCPKQIDGKCNSRVPTGSLSVEKNFLTPELSQDMRGQAWQTQPQLIYVPQLAKEPSEFDAATMFNNNYLTSLEAKSPGAMDFTLGAGNDFNPGITTFTNDTFDGGFPPPPDYELADGQPRTYLLDGQRSTSFDSNGAEPERSVLRQSNSLQTAPFAGSQETFYPSSQANLSPTFATPPSFIQRFINRIRSLLTF